MWSDALITAESKPRVTASITRAAVGQCETDSVAWQSDLRHGGPIMGLLVEETAPVPTSRPSPSQHPDVDTIAARSGAATDARRLWNQRSGTFSTRRTVFETTYSAQESIERS